MRTSSRVASGRNGVAQRRWEDLQNRWDSKWKSAAGLEAERTEKRKFLRRSGSERARMGSHWRPFKDLLEKPREMAGGGPAGVATAGRDAP